MAALAISLIVFSVSLGYVAGAMFRGAPPIAAPPIALPRLPRLPRVRAPNLRPLLAALSALWMRRRRPSAEIAEDSQHGVHAAAPTANEARTSGAPNGTQTAPSSIAAPHIQEDIPSEWLDELQSAGLSLEVKSYVEAAAQVLRLEVAKYREQLVECDERARAMRLAGEWSGLTALVADLKRINGDWLGKQSAAASVLQSRRKTDNDTANFGARLEETLLEQQAQIETTSNNVDQIDLSTDPERAVGRLLDEMGRLVDLAHLLRDRMQETLLAVLWHDGRLATIDRRMQLDAQTGVLSRAGLERVLYEWRRDDPNRTRLLSMGLVDVDAFARFNVSCGPRCGDRLLRAIADLTSGQMRHDRGFDRLARVDGQRFVVLFGDAGPQQALSALERIRQTMEATEFHHGAVHSQMTASCGVIEVNPKDDVQAIYSRLANAVREAKKAGRNRTFLDKGDGPAPTSPPAYNVRARIVELDVATAAV